MKMMINAGTKKNPILLNAAAAVALYEIGGGGKYIVRRSDGVALLLMSGLVKHSGRDRDPKHYQVEVTQKGRAAKTRIRKNIF